MWIVNPVCFILVYIIYFYVHRLLKLTENDFLNFFFFITIGVEITLLIKTIYTRIYFWKLTKKNQN